MKRECPKESDRFVRQVNHEAEQKCRIHIYAGEIYCRWAVGDAVCDVCESVSDESLFMVNTILARMQVDRFVGGSFDRGALEKGA